MVHIGRPHTSLPYRGDGGGSAELPAIGNTALLGTNSTGVYGGYPLAAVLVSLLQAATQAELEKVTVRAEAAGAALTTTIDGKQPLNAKLTALAALALGTNKVLYVDGTGALAVADLTAAGRAVLDDVDNTAQRQTLGLRIGQDVQAYDAELALLAGLTAAADKVPLFTGPAGATTMTVTAAARNLLDDATVNDMIATLGLNIAQANPQTGTSYTLALTDFNRTVTMNNAAANTLYIPTNTAVPFPVNSLVNFACIGAGQTTVAAVTPGTTLVRSAGNKYKTSAQYAFGAAWKIDTDELLIFGDLST